jgi:hypothetical protein
MSVQFVTEYAVWGAIGGLVSILVKDGGIELPKIKDGKIYLGSMQGIILGIISGLIGDSTPFNAFMWGAAGGVVLTGLVNLSEAKARLINRDEDTKQ